jgi:signal transduction histidine kinase
VPGAPALYADGVSTPAPARFRWVLTWALPALAAVVTLAVAWPTAIVELGVPPGVAPALGLAAALPVAAVGVAPVPAWALSAFGAVIVAATIGPFPGHPWPFAVMQGIALLGLFVVVVLRAGPPTAARAAVVTALVFGIGMHSASGLLWALVIVPGIAGLAWLVRQLGVSRRRLAASEETSERERARRAMLEERTRIARELHDVVAHAMSMIVVRTETAPYRLPDLPEDVREELTAIGSAARSSLAEVRGLLGVLRTEDAEPPRAPTPGMAEIDDLLDTSRRAGMDIEVVRDGAPGPVDAASALSLYRILAEALANAARHASGAPVTVVLEDTATTVRLEVRNHAGHDDGPGAGLGLAGMRDRAAVVGGDLTAGPTADGWQVTAVLPREVGAMTTGTATAGSEDR